MKLIESIEKVLGSPFLYLTKQLSLKTWCLFFSLLPVLTFCCVPDTSKPKLSIITSLWKGDEFIQGFMEDITNQTIFSECELILINANSPGTEEIVIQPYLKRFSNIKYIKLDQDPGLYAVWNMGIRMASGEYLTNANIDDRSRKDAYETHLKALESHPEIDLVYCGFYVSNTANQTFDKENIYTPLNLKSANPDEFSIPNMRICLPGPRPVWRKAMHEKYGFFDETFTVVSDWAFWIRAASRGSKFLKIPGLYTVFYLNPDGTSTPKNAHRQALGKLEGDYIKLRYGHLWEINENQ